MLTVIVWILAALVGPNDASERLRLSAPTYLDEERAVVHLWSARVAAVVAHEDASDLLAIAWHESRYTSNVVTVEPGNRVSCGVMTPAPHAPPCVDRPLVEQYLEGALHLHEWREQLGGNAMLGYAGLAGACARGPYVVTRRGVDVDLCGFQPEMQWRARLIRGTPRS